jgi:hypothetical protein
MVFAGVVFTLFIVLSVVVAFGSASIQRLTVAAGLLALVAISSVPHGRVVRGPATFQLITFACCALVSAYLTREFGWLPILTLLLCAALAALFACVSTLIERKVNSWHLIFGAAGVLSLLWLGLRLSAVGQASWISNVPIMESFGLESGIRTRLFPLFGFA